MPDPSAASREERPLRVYTVLFFGLMTFSFSPILVRFASEAPGLAIAVWRTLFAVLLLAPAAWLKVRPEVRAFEGRDWMLVAVAGVLLGLHFVTWIESLYYTSVASASVLVTTNPIFMAILGYVFLRERLSLPVVAAIVLGVTGAALLSWGDVAAPVAEGRRPLLGNTLALSASLLVSVYLLIGRVVRQKTSWLAYVFPLYTIVALTTLALAALLGTKLLGYSAGFYGLCLLMAIGPQILGHGSFNYAIRFLPAAFLGLLGLVEPVGASIMAYFFFGEAPGVLALVGIVVILASVASAIVSRRRRAKGRLKRSGGSAAN